MTGSDVGPANPPLLERLAAVSALVTSLALALSFIYDWGFFSALGISFGSAPTSISDHLRTGLVWASRLAPAVLLVLAFGLLTRRIERGLTEEEIIEASPDPEHVRKKRNRPLKVAAYISFGSMLVWFITGWGRTPWIPAIICWIWFIMWVMSPPLVKARHSPSFWLFASIGSLLLISFFSIGYEDAKSAMSRDSPVTAHIQSCEGSVEACPVTKAGVLRSFPQWLLVRDSSTVYWIRSDHVQRIDASEGNRSSFPGLMCVFFAKCPSSETGPTMATPTTEERHGESREELGR